MQTKVTVDFLSGVSRQRRANTVRYWLAMRCLDEKGVGWVVVEDILPQLADLFSVQEKTVWNMLWLLENEKLGNFGGNKFFLYSEKRLAQAFEIELKSKQAVIVTLADLRGGITKARATFDSAVLATKNTEKAITRDKRQELTGRSRTTQIKYDKIAGTQVKHNYAVIMDFDEWWFEYFKLQGQPVFKIWYQGKYVIVRAMANTYQSQLQSTKKRIPTLPYKGGANRVFFEDFEKALQAYNQGIVDVFYTEGHTWFYVPQDIKV